MKHHCTLLHGDLHHDRDSSSTEIKNNKKRDAPEQKLGCITCNAPWRLLPRNNDTACSQPHDCGIPLVYIESVGADAATATSMQRVDRPVPLGGGARGWLQVRSDLQWSDPCETKGEREALSSSRQSSAWTGSPVRHPCAQRRHPSRSGHTLVTPGTRMDDKPTTSKLAQMRTRLLAPSVLKLTKSHT